MWLRIAFYVLLSSVLPVAVCAQAQNGGDGPPPEMRAKMDAVRANAKTAALADLEPDHRAKVQAVVDGFDAPGSTMTVADAAKQIDAILSPVEAKAVLAEQQKMRDAMRAAFAAGGGPGGGGPAGAPDGAGPGSPNGMGAGPGGDGPPPGGGSGFGGRGMGRRRGAADAGRFFLQVAAAPDRFREAMRAERGAEPPQPPN